MLVHAYNPRLRQENHEFEAGLNYTMRHCLKKSKAKKKKYPGNPQCLPAVPTDVLLSLPIFIPKYLVFYVIVNYIFKLSFSN